MPRFVIKHVLPDGSVAGYHADSCCTVVQSRDSAKVPGELTRSQAEQWLRTVRTNFEFAWSDDSSDMGGGLKYRSYDIWKGHSIDQVQTVLEELGA